MTERVSGLADADKRAYADYFELCLQLLRRRGILALDNVLWYGKVADPAVSTPCFMFACFLTWGNAMRTSGAYLGISIGVLL